MSLKKKKSNLFVFLTKCQHNPHLFVCKGQTSDMEMIAVTEARQDYMRDYKTDVSSHLYI